ncbi:hypothetical protein Bbelb_029690 [Branchiostoma belcheri]|nr:hypothetical protein Bbelb_029690 [Branchiostoma belcheri]
MELIMNSPAASRDTTSILHLALLISQPQRRFLMALYYLLHKAICLYNESLPATDRPGRSVTLIRDSMLGDLDGALTALSLRPEIGQSAEVAEKERGESAAEAPMH